MQKGMIEKIIRTARQNGYASKVTAIHVCADGWIVNNGTNARQRGDFVARYEVFQ